LLALETGFGAEDKGGPPVETTRARAAGKLQKGGEVEGGRNCGRDGEGGAALFLLLLYIFVGGVLPANVKSKMRRKFNMKFSKSFLSSAPKNSQISNFFAHYR